MRGLNCWHLLKSYSNSADEQSSPGDNLVGWLVESSQDEQVERYILNLEPCTDVPPERL